MKTTKEQNGWNIAFSLLFVVLVVTAFAFLSDNFGQFKWLYVIDALDITILALATFRIIRLVTFDKIFTFVRNWFMDEQEDGTYVKPENGVRLAIAELIECLWCTGLWAGFLVIALYFSSDIGRFAVLILAIAAIGSFLQQFSRTLGRIGK